MIINISEYPDVGKSIHRDSFKVVWYDNQGERHAVKIREENGEIRIAADQRLLVQPNAANSISISTARF